MCLDEFKASTICGKYALIIGDHIFGKIFDILPSRKQDYIYYYFQTISVDERNNVKYIVTDLFESYKEAYKGSFNKYTKYANVLKKYNRLLLANKYTKEAWFFDQKQIASYIQKEMTFQEIIEYCLNFDSDLETAYIFYKIYIK